MTRSPIDAAKLDKLAEVAIRVGLQLQEGQDLVLTGPSTALPLIRKIAEHAYKAGAGVVMPIISDEEVTLARYRKGGDDCGVVCGCADALPVLFLMLQGEPLSASSLAQHVKD